MMRGRTTAAPAPSAEAVRVREADGEADAFYLQRQLHHWFGAEYESQTALQYDLFPIAGWTLPDGAPNRESAPRDAFGVIAEHRRGEATVRVGGGVVLLLDAAQAADECAPASFDGAALVSDPTAFLLVGVVDQAWRGRGLGGALFDRRLDWARASDAEMALSFGWERRDGPTSRPLFEARGFEPIERIDGLYAETDRASCPDCGVWPGDDAACRCDATIWAREVTGE